jgi:hypothetical protein
MNNLNEHRHIVYTLLEKPQKKVEFMLLTELLEEECDLKLQYMRSL